MKEETIKYLICPKTGSKLTLQNALIDNEIIEGELVNDNGDKYVIRNSFPDLVYDEIMIGDSTFARNYYTEISETYDENLHVTFDLYHDTEQNVRDYMISLLNLTPDSTVLEISAGTGKDSIKILEKLTGSGFLTALDITPAMLEKAKENISKGQANVDFIVGSAISLPFPDNTFDALYCFAGVGHFPDIPKALKEMARVVKTGGRVVFCEKNVPPWLRNTEYGKILINNNPMFADEIPLQYIPVEARNVGVRWILGNVHYVVDYTVGEGMPEGHFDLILPGERGGSFNSRYYGKLEGVSPEAKNLAHQARKELNVSMYDWLNELITREAKKILGE